MNSLSSTSFTFRPRPGAERSASLGACFANDVNRNCCFVCFDPVLSAPLIVISSKQTLLTSFGGPSAAITTTFNLIPDYSLPSWTFSILLTHQLAAMHFNVAQITRKSFHVSFPLLSLSSIYNDVNPSAIDSIAVPFRKFGLARARRIRVNYSPSRSLIRKRSKARRIRSRTR